MNVKWLLAYGVLLNAIVFGWNSIQFNSEGGMQMMPIILESVELDVAPILLVSQVSAEQLEKNEKTAVD